MYAYVYVYVDVDVYVYAYVYVYVCECVCVYSVCVVCVYVYNIEKCGSSTLTSKPHSLTQISVLSKDPLLEGLQNDVRNKNSHILRALSLRMRKENK